MTQRRPVLLAAFSDKRGTSAVFSDSRHSDNFQNSDKFQEQQDEDDRKYQAQSAAAIITPPRTSPVSAIAKAKDQHDENDEQQHSISFLVFCLACGHIPWRSATPDPASFLQCDAGRARRGKLLGPLPIRMMRLRRRRLHWSNSRA